MNKLIKKKGLNLNLNLHFIENLEIDLILSINNKMNMNIMIIRTELNRLIYKLISNVWLINDLNCKDI